MHGEYQLYDHVDLATRSVRAKRVLGGGSKNYQK